LTMPKEGRVKLETPAEHSDEVLMTEVHGGSSEALSLLFQRYARLVHTISNRILRDSAEADDLLIVRG
jgi:DNA-directed RNA polymerase specialized sigma subunit